jgi:pyruvate carboxylase subunit B
MVLGYFGKTPVKPDEEIIKLASEQLNLPPTTENPLDIADRDETKSIAYWKKRLEEENIETTEENIFIAASCGDKGIAFLKGESPLMIRKKEDEEKKAMSKTNGIYTVIVDGEKFTVEIAEGNVDVKPQTPVKKEVEIVEDESSKGEAAGGMVEIKAAVPGTVWKILVNPGDKVKAGDKIMILESMKMEIDIPAPQDGVIAHIAVKVNDTVEEGQVLATME